MLTQSWVLFEGIGQVTESKLWEQGLRDWTDDKCFQRACEIVPKLSNLKTQRDHALKALSARASKLIAQTLPQNEIWRLWDAFKEEALFLDIETNGLGAWAHITVLGTYFKNKYRAFVHGENLQEALDYIGKASLIVTFNGRQFDVPFIERHFEQKIDTPHIDLRFVAASLGHKGGLKKIEPQFGIQRDAAIKGVDGYEAVLLWKKHQRGDRDALKKLIEYNQADVEGLPLIMNGCWQQKLDYLA